MIDGVNGRVIDPDPDALADALSALAADRTRAAGYGLAGYEWARLITWNDTIDRLVAGL